MLFLPFQVGDLPFPKRAASFLQIDAGAPTITSLIIQDGDPDSRTPEYMRLYGYSILPDEKDISFRESFFQICRQGCELFLAHDYLFRIIISGSAKGISVKSASVTFFREYRHGSMPPSGRSSTLSPKTKDPSCVTAFSKYPISNRPRPFLQGKCIPQSHFCGIVPEAYL